MEGKAITPPGQLGKAIGTPQAQVNPVFPGSQHHLLGRQLVTPRQPPNLEYITAIEAACTKLSQQEAEELRADINRVLRSFHPPKPNLTKAQNAALRELKRDRDCIVLTANKGVAMVVMDKQDYINKANQLIKIPIKLSLRTPLTPLKINSLTFLKVLKLKQG